MGDRISSGLDQTTYPDRSGIAGFQNHGPSRRLSNSLGDTCAHFQAKKIPLSLLTAIPDAIAFISSKLIGLLYRLSLISNKDNATANSDCPYLSKGIQILRAFWAGLLGWEFKYSEPFGLGNSNTQSLLGCAFWAGSNKVIIPRTPIPLHILPVFRFMAFARYYLENSLSDLRLSRKNTEYNSAAK